MIHGLSILCVSNFPNMARVCDPLLMRKREENLIRRIYLQRTLSRFNWAVLARFINKVESVPVLSFIFVPTTNKLFFCYYAQNWLIRKLYVGLKYIRYLDKKNSQAIQGGVVIMTFQVKYCKF